MEIAAMAVPTRLALVSDTVDNRAPRRLRLRNPWRGCDKWWELVVMLPHETACKAGAFLVEPHPQTKYCPPQEHAALVLPQAWVVLETSLCWLARGIIWRKRERSAGPGQIPMPRRSLYKIVRSRRQPTTHQVAAIRRTAIHNKERTPLRALVSRTRRYFTADVSVFQAHLPCDSLSIFSYR